jgi:hypothetical protein
MAEFEEIVDGIRHGWQPIDTYEMPKDDSEWYGSAVLVDNGERVGEARPERDYGLWDGEEGDIPLSWAWTHHSTCSCCHSFMDPQPLWWQPLPAPAPRKEP